MREWGAEGKSIIDSAILQFSFGKFTFFCGWFCIWVVSLFWLLKRLWIRLCLRVSKWECVCLAKWPHLFGTMPVVGTAPAEFEKLTRPRSWRLQFLWRTIVWESFLRQRSIHQWMNLWSHHLVVIANSQWMTLGLSEIKRREKRVISKETLVEDMSDYDLMKISQKRKNTGQKNKLTK